MPMRVKFREEVDRKKFFELLKTGLNSNWKNIRKKFNVPKSTFEKYKNGKLLISDDLFEKLLIYVDENKKKSIKESIENLPDNFGQIKGGKKAYVINFEKFKEGRKIRSKSGEKLNKQYRNLFKGFDLKPEVCELIGAFIGDGCFNVYKNKVYPTF